MVNFYKYRLLIIVIFVFGVFVSCNNETKKMTPKKSILVVKDSIYKDSSEIIDKPNSKKVKLKKSCGLIVKEILITSERYKQITKGLNQAIVRNGGESFGVSLEKSPNPKHDKAWEFANTYEFVIYEKYSDRQLNTFRFSFNPKTKKLYEYDPISDKLKPIAFDKKLLKQYDSVLKSNREKI